MTRVGRLLRTIRPLGPRPLAIRAGLEVRRRVRVALGRRAREVPSTASLAPGASRLWTLSPFLRPIDGGAATAATIDRGTLRMLGIELPVTPRFPWQDPEIARRSPLWRMKLHHHDFVVDLLRAATAAPPETARRYREIAVGALADWITTNRPDLPDHWLDSWNAYAISRRLVNWCAARLLLGNEGPEPGALSGFAESAHRQADFLLENLERDHDGNHLLADAIGLLAAAALVSSPRSETWRRAGTALLEECLERQVLADGGHVERAPLYHLQVLNDVADALVLLDEEERAPVAKRLERLARFATLLAHGGRRLPFFGDGVPGEQPPLDVSLARARGLIGRDAGGEPPSGRIDLPSSGFFRFASSDESFTIRGGPIGWERSPAHAHDDLFSFELETAGAPFIVDSGVGGYGGDPFRPYARSGEAHNTFLVDGFGSAEPWGVFRLGGRSTLLASGASGDGEAWSFGGRAECWHDRSIVVSRRVVREGAGAWTVEDRVETGHARRVESRIHLHPSWTVDRVGPGAFELTGPGGRWSVRPVDASVEGALERGERDPSRGWFFPEFGVALPAPTIVYSSDASRGLALGYRIVRRSPLA